MKTYKQNDDASRNRVEERDQVIVSGYVLSDGKYVYGMKGVVGSADKVQFKVWPWADPYGNCNGKLWFGRRFSRVKITRKWWE